MIMLCAMARAVGHRVYSVISPLVIMHIFVIAEVKNTFFKPIGPKKEASTKVFLRANFSISSQIFQLNICSQLLGFVIKKYYREQNTMADDKKKNLW